MNRLGSVHADQANSFLLATDVYDQGIAIDNAGYSGAILATDRPRRGARDSSL